MESRVILRIGTRMSRLAEWQAQSVAMKLERSHPGLQVELVRLKTHGDRDQVSPLDAMGGVGVFTKEIQRALLDGAVDVAVHSLKDLPTSCPPTLTLSAVPDREDVADALIAPEYQTLQKLPPGARLGTSSLRRQAQIRYYYPNLCVVPIRGNVQTRVQLALEGKLHGVILATAGLNRLDMQHLITEQLGPPQFLPAVGQGALGIECRSNDERTRRLVQCLDCVETHLAVLAERATLAELHGGCAIPMGAWARTFVDSDGLTRLALDAAVFDLTGHIRIASSRTGPCDEPMTLGQQVAFDLLAHGAKDLLQQQQSP